MLLLQAMEITISTEIDDNGRQADVSNAALTALQNAVALLAAEGRNADFIMQAVLQACIEKLPEFKQHLEELEHSRMLERLEHLRKRGLLALA
jgi:hypothetical protein